MAASTVPATAATRRKTARPPAKPAAGVSAALRKEIENQKQWVAKSLKTLRDHPLPAGATPAFVFAPLAPAHDSGRDSGGGSTP